MLKINTVKDMKAEILNIAKNFENNNLTINDARTLLLGLFGVSDSASQFEEDIFKLINAYVNEGLSKSDLVRKMEWITSGCEMS